MYYTIKMEMVVIIISGLSWPGNWILPLRFQHCNQYLHCDQIPLKNRAVFGISFTMASSHLISTIMSTDSGCLIYGSPVVLRAFNQFTIDITLWIGYIPKHFTLSIAVRPGFANQPIQHTSAGIHGETFHHIQHWKRRLLRAGQYAWPIRPDYYHIRIYRALWPAYVC